MKITVVVVMAAMAVVRVWAAQSTTTQEATVTVCIEWDPNIAPGTLPLASKMFASIGVRIHWRERRSCPLEAGAIAVSLSSDTPNNQVPGAFAFARPYEGTIVVFADRVGTRQELNGDRGPGLWAHVLVHEITHILQGIDQHSATGIMKARWDGHDYFEMGWKPLPFAQEDIGLIYDGLKLRQARLAVAARAAASPAAVAVQ